MIANWFATLVHRPLQRSLAGFVRSDPKAQPGIAYAVILITGRYPLAGSKVDELARQDAERAGERAEIVQAAIDEPLVREQPSLEPSWQPGRAQGSTSLTLRLRPSLRCDRTPAPGARG